ncbi:MAG: DHH family phosphoesterase [Candidatus Moranbacteria bacterium]|nr:DHH family phosphoesterase [Candidatus Moranbacteria bacterium]
MSLIPQEQFQKFITEAKDVLIFIPENPGFDDIGSAFALAFFLENRSIPATIVSGKKLAETKFEFLPHPKNITAEISGAREFVLSFDTSRNKITGLRQEIIGDAFNVYLTPEKGSIDPRDFSFILAKFKYDLIVVLDSPDLESLGQIYLNNSDLFFEVPVINIDHRSNNENFGQINLVDITASSCAEILKPVLENIDAISFDKNIATCLMVGIIGATGNFQKKNTTPKALSAAADLMDRGADQQGIIRWLYKTQPLSILKLLGRVMSKLSWEEKSKLAWAALSLDDFVQSRTTPESLPVILDKLQENYSDGQIFMILYNDTPSSSLAVIKTVNNELLQKIALLFGATASNETLEIKLAGSDLILAAKTIQGKIESL